MKLSIVIPAYNAEKYLEDAVNSIDYEEAEIIVVNDGSTDATLEIANRLGCRVVDQKNEGLAKARNNGAQVASGDILLFLDSDDCFFPQSIEKLLERYDKNSIVRGRAVEYYSEDLPEDERKKLELKKGAFFGLITGCLIPKEIFNVLGGFSESVGAGEAIEFTLKAKDAGIRIEDFELDVVRRRIHSSNFGRNHKQEEFRSYLSILKARMKKNA